MRLQKGATLPGLIPPDAQTTEWMAATHTLVDHRRFPVGSRHWVRYGPRRPRRRSTIFVEWDGT